MRYSSLIRNILFRLVLFVPIFGIALLSSDFGHAVNELLGYRPSGFFGFILADWELAVVLCLVFWGGVIYGTVGKKIDYVFFVFIILFAIWEYIYPPSVNPEMYLGLLGGVVIGSAIGFGLKVLRKRIWK